jgi:hypothetical protein
VGKRTGFLFFGTLLVWELLDVYGRLDLLSAKLRALGPGGEMIAHILMSSGFRFALIIGGLILVGVKGEHGHGRSRKEQPIKASTREICSVYARDGHTTYIADQIFKSTYSGKLLRVSGIVRDVSPKLIAFDKTEVWLDESEGGRMSVVIEFSRGEKSTVSHLKRGDRLSAIGKIEHATADFVSLSDGRIVT